jgi:hypothetical protein
MHSPASCPIFSESFIPIPQVARAFANFRPHAIQVGLFTKYRDNSRPIFVSQVLIASLIK